MLAAEASGQFDYDPNYVQPAAAVDASRMPLVAFAEPQTTIGSANGVAQSAVAGGSVDGDEKEAAAKPPAVLKRKNSLDEFELEIEGINLDDNIDTSVS